jgi:translation initiation factor IF-3
MQRYDFVMNEQIRATEVRVIDSMGGQVGVLTRDAALAMAQEQEKDLILVTAQATPPVVKIIEASKHKYQQEQRQQEVRKASKTGEIKELRLSPFIAAGDLESRTKRVREFLEDGHKVRLMLRFKGREITKKEFGHDVMDKLYQAVSDVAQIETAPKLAGKMLMMQLMPGKKKKEGGAAEPSSAQ